MIKQTIEILAIISLLGLSTYSFTKYSEPSELEYNASYCIVSPPYSYYTDSEINVLANQIYLTDNQTQMTLIQQFIQSNQKFFSSAQIVLIMSLIPQAAFVGYQPKNIAFQQMIPYLAKMSAAEAGNILKAVYSSSGILFPFIIPMICDFSPQTYGDIIIGVEQPSYYIQKYFTPQLSRTFKTGPFLTTNGKQGVFFFQNSNTMFAPITSQGIITTRYNILRKFYNLHFGDLISQLDTYGSCFSLPGLSKQFPQQFSQDPNLALDFLMNTDNLAGFAYYQDALNNIYSLNPQGATDVYILGDGFSFTNSGDIEVSSGYTQNFQNQKIRINTFSFLMGGNQSPELKQKAREYYKKLSLDTNGSYIEIPENF